MWSPWAHTWTCVCPESLLEACIWMSDIRNSSSEMWQGVVTQPMSRCCYPKKAVTISHTSWDSQAQGTVGWTGL